MKSRMAYTRAAHRHYLPFVILSKLKIMCKQTRTRDAVGWPIVHTHTHTHRSTACIHSFYKSKWVLVRQETSPDRHAKLNVAFCCCCCCYSCWVQALGIRQQNASNLMCVICVCVCLCVSCVRIKDFRINFDSQKFL